MRHFFDGALEQTNNQQTSKNFQAIFMSLFGVSPEQEFALPVVWNNLKELIRNSSLSSSEKKYIEEYFNGRRNENFQGISDAKKFSQNLNISLFDLLNNNDYEDASKILAYMGPRLIHKNYGEAVLFWVWFYVFDHNSNSIVNQTFEQYLQSNKSELVGNKRNFELLMIARFAMKQFGYNPLNTLALYNMFLNLPGFVENYDIGKMLDSQFFSIEVNYISSLRRGGQHQKWSWTDMDNSGNDIGENVDKVDDVFDEEGYEEFSKYGKCINWEGRQYKIWMDSPCGITLKYKGLPIAIIGFTLADKNEIFINQIQQISYNVYDKYGRTTGSRVDEIVKKIEWKEILLSIVEEFSHKYGYSNITIQSGKNNRWTKKKRVILDEYDGSIITKQTKIPHLSKEIAKQIYDVFARDNGFKRGVEGNWQKSLI